MAKRFRNAVVATAAFAVMPGFFGMTAARAAVAIQWFQDPTGTAPYGDFDEFPGYTTGNSASSSSFISLDPGNHALENIEVTSTGGTYTGGSPLADYTSTNAGNTPAPNTLTAFTFTKGPDAVPINKFDGVYFLGRIDSENGAPTETVTVNVNYVDFATDLPGEQTHVFTVDPPNIGRIGFDEVEGVSDDYGITSVSFSLTPGAAAWNNIDVVVFSVPELSTWGMILLGFAGLGYAGLGRAFAPRIA
jgi:hypothetical protein